MARSTTLKEQVASLAEEMKRDREQQQRINKALLLKLGIDDDDDDDDAEPPQKIVIIEGKKYVQENGSFIPVAGNDDESDKPTKGRSKSSAKGRSKSSAKVATLFESDHGISVDWTKPNKDGDTFAYVSWSPLDENGQYVLARNQRVKLVFPGSSLPYLTESMAADLVAAAAVAIESNSIPPQIR